jgi:hypothetical protein
MTFLVNPEASVIKLLSVVTKTKVKKANVFFIGSSFYPCPIFDSKGRSLLSERRSIRVSLEWGPALLSNIRQGWQ